MLTFLFRWRARSCVRDIVWLWRSHVSGHGPDHHTLATWYCANVHVPTFEPQSIYLLLFLLFSSSSLPSLFCALFPPLEMRSTLVYYACFLLCPSWERRALLLVCFACLAGTITLEVVEWYVWFSLGGGWPDDVRFPRRSRDSPPLVIVWAEDVSIMWQTLMM